jgi:hypothetical protein
MILRKCAPWADAVPWDTLGPSMPAPGQGQRPRNVQPMRNNITTPATRMQWGCNDSSEVCSLGRRRFLGYAGALNASAWPGGAPAKCANSVQTYQYACHANAMGLPWLFGSVLDLWCAQDAGIDFAALAGASESILFPMEDAPKNILSPSLSLSASDGLMWFLRCFPTQIHRFSLARRPLARRTTNFADRSRSWTHTHAPFGTLTDASRSDQPVWSLHRCAGLVTSPARARRS